MMKKLLNSEMAHLTLLISRGFIVSIDKSRGFQRSDFSKKASSFSWIIRLASSVFAHANHGRV